MLPITKMPEVSPKRWLGRAHKWLWSRGAQFFAATYSSWERTFNPTIEPIEPWIRIEAGERLARITHAIDASTARLVLEAQLEAVRILREASGSLDTKANVIIVAGGALLTAFVTISPLEKSHIPHWTLISVLILLGGGFLSGIAAIFVAGFSLPTPAVYNRYSTLCDARNEGKICSELAEAWYRYGLRERRLNATKANRVTLGLAFVAIALLVLVIGAAIAVFGPEQLSTAVVSESHRVRGLDVL